MPDTHNTVYVVDDDAGMLESLSLLPIGRCRRALQC